MKTNNKLHMRPLAALIVGVLVFPGIAMAASPAGQVLVASGKVKAVSADGKTRDLNRRAPIYAGDKLVTATRANAQVKFTDGAIVSLKPSTELRVDEYAYEEGGLQKAFMSLVRGGFRTVTGAIGKTSRADYRVSTPVATIGIRGTLYDADFDPESGLDMAVWEGGIEACSESGCVDLGSDASHRFGTIGTDGTFRGRNEQRSGGEDGARGGDSADEGDGAQAGDNEGGDGSDMPQFQPDIDQEISEAIVLLDPVVPPPPQPEPEPIPVDPLRIDYPLAGLMVSGQNALVNLLPAGVFGANYAQFYSYQYTDPQTLQPIPLWGMTAFGGDVAAGDYLLSGWDQGTGCVNECRHTLYPMVWEAGDTTVYWGSWEGYEGDGTYAQMSLTQDPDVPSATGIFDSGAYVFGDYSSPTVVSQLVGSTSFYYLGGVIGDGWYDKPMDGMGSLTFDLATGVVDGNLRMGLYSQLWQLDFGGDVSSNGFQNLFYRNTSYLDNYGLVSSVDTAKSQLALQFVGATQVLGVIGSFDVWTIDPVNPINGQGVFVMGAEPTHFAFSRTGFGVAPGAGNPWTGASVVQLDYAQLNEDPAMTGAVRLAATGNALGGNFLVSGVDAGTGCTGSCLYQLTPTLVIVGAGYTQVYWGEWAAGDLSVSADPYSATATEVANPGFYVFGDMAPPEVVAQLEGTSSFFQLVTLDARQYSQAGTSLTFTSGQMTVDLTGSAPVPVSGSLSVEMSTTDNWFLAFDGSVTTAGALALNLKSDAVTPANGSYFMPSNGIPGTDDKSLVGNIQGAFVGHAQVDGVVGAFDVKTADSAESLMGVFVMDGPQF